MHAYDLLKDKVNNAKQEISGQYYMNAMRVRPHMERRLKGVDLEKVSNKCTRLK